MWNRNNAYDYSDPSGFDVIYIVAPATGYPLGAHTSIKVTRHSGKVVRYSFGDSKNPLNPTGVIQRKDNNFDAGFKPLGAPTKLASCAGEYHRGRDGTGFDEAGLDKTASEIDHAGVNYDSFTRNSNSATYTMCARNGGGAKCKQPPNAGPNRVPGWGNDVLPSSK